MEKYKNILCAIDFSQNCQLAATRAAELAQHYDAELTLLHVVEYFPERRSNEWIEPEGADPMAYQEEKARGLLAELASQLGRDDIGQEVRFTPHSARHEIIRYAEAQKIDLVVVASHGRHGITALLGSTANGLVHSAHCDVLVVRAE